MPAAAVEVRPFRRDDRHQLAELVNAHVGAVLPGVSVSVNAALHQLEREPDEYVVDPWAVERAALVAVEHDRVVAAALLVRYADEERVGPSYRGTGELRYMLAWPSAARTAGDALAAACVAQLRRWGVRRLHADGALPAPAVYGIPDCWPHVRGILERAGFVAGDRIEIVLLAAVEDLPHAGPAPVDGLTVTRHVGDLSTGFTARLGDRVAGFIEVRADLTQGGALSRLAGWAELDNLHVDPDLRRRGIATWLMGQAADWLRLAGARLLLDYAVEGDDDGGLPFALATRFRRLVRTTRGFERPVDDSELG